MEKRYQVFVSSTFRDLQAERREVIQALLEMNCIPAGMELFPASDSNAWNLIRRVIDLSDYYVLIVGGRYGSVDADGVSFTEREYDYAVQAEKHILPFLHENPQELPGKCLEMNEEGQRKLATFRKKVQDARHCKYWTSPADLGGKVSRGLVAAITESPGIGWVRGNLAKSIEDVERLAAAEHNALRLRGELDQLQAAHNELRKESSHIPNSLAQLRTTIRELLLRIKAELDGGASGEDLQEIFAQGIEKLVAVASTLDDKMFPLDLNIERAISKMTSFVRSDVRFVERDKLMSVCAAIEGDLRLMQLDLDTRLSQGSGH